MKTNAGDSLSIQESCEMSAAHSCEYRPLPDSVLRDISRQSLPKLSLRMRVQGILIRLQGRAHTFWLEVRSFRYRIQFQSNKTGCVQIVQCRDIPSLRGLPAYMSKVSSSDCIKQLEARYPWVSLSDVSLYQQGWEAGVLSYARTLLAYNEQNCNEKETGNP